ncbi:MAG TPA: TonB-dependent receptor [Ohtaekwangia sp.]|nr:TonB-dependent receptor [Ohtaekwangia sp.]
MKHYTFITLFLLGCTAVQAQTSYSITGQVVDESNAAVPYANAALYNNLDSTLVTGAVSDGEGNFTIATKPGNYYLKVTFLSYEEKTIPNVNVINSDVSLGTIALSSSSQVLDAVTVQGEKSQMELYLDKRVFQVGKDLSNISGSASDILDNVPSVAVDVDGNISLRGSGNVRILIDGRPSGLTGISTADALRQIPGNLIESVEVITNPSARFDAEGEVGIINIVLKKEKGKGINGSFSVNGGYPDNYGASFNVNFRKDKFNLFTSYGISYRANPGKGYSIQSFQDAELDTAFSFRQNNNRSRSDLSHSLRAGLDYYLSEKSILTGSFVVRTSNGLNKSKYEYLYFDNNDILGRTVVRTEREEEPELNTEIALSYRKEYARKGRLLTADFKWIENVETEKARFREIDLSIDSLSLQRSRNTENERNALFQMDYVHPFNEKGKVEAGFKSTLRMIDNDFTVRQQNLEDETWHVIPNLNNNLIYTENIHSAYFIAGNEIGRFSWQGGVRGEYTDVSVELAETSDINYQEYFNLFPSAHLSYRLSPEKTLQLSYSYRLSRPRFRDLMPFSNYSDNRSVFVGNPDLKPEYTNSIEAGYLINWETGSILSSAYYRYRTGVVQRITEQIEDSIGYTRTLPVNLATEDAYGLEFNLSWNPVDWWRLNTNANFYRAITEGDYRDERFYSDTYTWTSRTTSKFTFFKKWDFQAGFNYRAPRITPQGRNRSMYFIDLGLSRDVLKGNGTVTLGVRDLLNSRKFRNIIQEEDYQSENEFQWRSRQVLFTFTYRLNTKKENRQQRQGNGPGNGEGGDIDAGGDF